MSMLFRLAVIVLALVVATNPLAGAGKPGASGATQAPTQGLTNADVIALVKAGLSDEVVVGRIRQETAPAFDTSVDGLVALKTAGVSDAVIAAMLSPAPAAGAALPVRPGDTATGSGRAPGIYMDTTGAGDSLVVLEPTVFTQGRTGGVLTSALTYGLYKAKWKAIVRSARASIRTANQKPTFYFTFASDTGSAFGGGGLAGLPAGATSPNEFVLAQMTRKRNERELIVGEFGALGTNTGTRSEDTIPLTIERLGPGEYKVTPDEVLGPGEFCFFFAGGAAATPGASGGGRLFDFGVDPVTGSTPDGQ